MILLKSALLLLVVSAASATPNHEALGPDLIVDLGYGTYQGHHDDSFNINKWLGIRYAEPPTGQLRWKLPQKPLPRQPEPDLISATQFPLMCPQSPPAQGAPYEFSEEDLGSEDCLFLNVYAPENKTNLPVMVWIHGGGYGIGSAAAFDFSYMNKVFGNKFIFVTIQYRLGAFGFLSSETVFKHGVLNVGLHDQRLALTWVQDHIHKFGGDAAQVTIAGESAGAGSVIHAAIANGGSDGDSLWRRGIMSSPYLPAQWMYNDSKPSGMYRKFAEIAGCLTSGMDLGETPDTSIFECLQNTDTVTLQAASAITSQQTTYGQWGFAPVIDLTLIRDQAMHLLRKGQVNGEKMLVGHNANEGTYFTFGPLKFPFPISLQPNFFVPQNITNEEQFVDFIRYYYRALSNQDVATILSLYAPDSRISAKSPKFASNGLTPPFSTAVSNFAVGWQQAANNLYAEAMFVCPAYWIADAYSSMLEINITSSRWAKLVPQLSWLYGDSGSDWHMDRPIYKQAWLYQFSVPDALHGVDLEPLLDDSQALGEEMMDKTFRVGFQNLWSRFIVNGNPTLSPEAADGPLRAASEEFWTKWGKNEQHQLLLLNVTESKPHAPDWKLADAHQLEGGRWERCSMWSDLGDRMMV